MNQNMHMSAAGYAALRMSEGVVMRYYNDAPVNGNCTWGVGTLAHLGPCTQEELRRTVTAEQVNQVLVTRVQEAERQVKSIVTETQLSQAQFDAAVSFAYNSSRANTRATLRSANDGDMATVAAQMRRNVMITPRDNQGRRAGAPRLSNGLVARREREAQPFLVPAR